MIYTHTVERALRYYPDRVALVSGDKRSTFRELHERVAGLAGLLASQGFVCGDRLALLLPNDPEYIELIYACSRLGVIAVPLNTRLSPKEVDRILADASPRGLIRHSSLPVPSVRLSWERVLDREPLEAANHTPSETIYDPDAVLALVYTSGTTGHPKGVVLTHANVFANVHFLNYWTTYEEGDVYLHAAPMFHILDLPHLFAAPAFGTCQVTTPKFTPQAFCEMVERQQVTQAVLVPTMINMLVQFPDLDKYDLSTWKQLAYGGSPDGSRPDPPNPRRFSNSQAGSTLRTERNGCSCRPRGSRSHGGQTALVRPALSGDRRAGRRPVWEMKSDPDSPANWSPARRMSCEAIGTPRRTPRPHFEMGCFVPETWATKVPTDISISSTASRT